MKASELRIGNLVIKSLKSGIGRKIEAKIGHADISRIFEETGSFNYEPIPLTDEWMVRFGFKKDEHCYYLGLDNVLVIEFIEDYAQLATINDGFSTGIDIYHVHQLQNLYFALTGEELKYD
jgi:hypothetical protein